MRLARHSYRTATQLGIAAAMVVAVGLGASGCTGGAEREAERTESRAKEDVRGVRNFIYDRGITVDTRTSP